MSQLISRCLFCLSLLIATPTISHAHTPQEQELVTKGENIRILDESGKEVGASAENIKSRLLHGKPLHFAEEQDEENRVIEAEWIVEALNTPGVNKIDIDKAIIKGHLYLLKGAHIYTFKESGLAEEEIQRLKDLKVNKMGLIPAPVPSGWRGSKGPILIEPPKTESFDKVGLVSTDIRITESRFLDIVHAIDLGKGIPMVFKGEVIFKGTVFEHGAAFVATNFQGVTDFSYTRFSGDEGTSFGGANFQGPTDFSGAQFLGEGSVLFTAAQFSGEGYTNFSKARFLAGLTRFTGAKFLGEVTNFSGARFLSIAKFRSARFEGRETYFSNAQFQGSVDFSSAYFRSSDGTYFRNTRFGKVLWFVRTVFSHKIDFYGSSFDEDVLFSEADFPKDLDVNLRKAIYNTLDITWSQLKGGRLDAPLREISAALKKNKEISANEFFEWEKVYRRLIANFEALGDRNSKLDAYYHFRRIRPIYKIITREDAYGAEEEFIVSKGWQEEAKWLVEYAFFGLTCGYGAKWERPPIVAIIIISIFTFVYFVGYYLKKTQQRLEKMPANVLKKLKRTGRLSRKIAFDEKAKILSVTGLMAREERDKLLSLWDDKMYQEAVNELFQTSGPLYHPRGERKPLRERWFNKLGNSFFGSFVTFTTLGLGGVTPSGGFKAAVITEGLMGWFTLALFLATLVNVLLT